MSGAKPTDNYLITEMRDAERKLAEAVKARNDGMAAYRKAMKEYSAVMKRAADRLLENSHRIGRKG